jgi:Flp pilus assembly protein CpaB
MKKTYALAAAAAVLAGGLLYIYLSGLGRAAGENPAASGADGPAYATVVIAAADIDEGTMLKEELLEVKSLPLGDVAADAASRMTRPRK